MSRRLTLDDVPDQVTFVDENDNPIDWPPVPLDQSVKWLVVHKARAWHKTIDQTLERIVLAAIREYITASQKKREARA